jgi:hypothetical protein
LPPVRYPCPMLTTAIRSHGWVNKIQTHGALGGRGGGGLSGLEGRGTAWRRRQRCRMAMAWGGGMETGRKPASPTHGTTSNSRQDSMATPGNFGGGSTGPDQIFLDMARAPPSPPGRGRAQSPVRRKPNPQATKHEAAREGFAVEVSYSSKAIGHHYRFWVACPYPGTQFPSSAFDSWA